MSKEKKTTLTGQEYWDKNNVSNKDEVDYAVANNQLKKEDTVSEPDKKKDGKDGKDSVVK